MRKFVSFGDMQGFLSSKWQRRQNLRGQLKLKTTKKKREKLEASIEELNQ